MKLRLGPRLIIAFMAVAFIPIIIVGSLSYQRAGSSLKAEAYSELEQEAILLDRDLQTFLEQFSSDIGVLSDTPAVQAIIRAKDNDGIDPVDDDPYEVWVDRLTQTFRANVKNKHSYKQIRYIDEHGDEVVRVESINGRVENVTGTEHLSNTRSEPYFNSTRGLSVGDVHISEMALNRNNGVLEVPHEPIIHFSTPIHDTSGQFRGILTSSVFGESVLHQLESERGEIYLTNQDGEYLLNPDKTKTFGFEKGASFNVDSDFSQVYEELEKNRSESEVGIEGHNVVDFKKIRFDRLNPDRHWLLVKTLSADEILEPVNALGKQILLVGGILMVLVVPLAIWTARSITKPVNEVVKGINSIAGGDISVPVNVNSSDEIGEMAKSYSNMQSYLREASDAAQRIGTGDLSTDVEPKSDKDMLGNALVSMTEGLKKRAEIANAIAAGDLNVQFAPDSEKDMLGNAFSRMVTGLKERANLAEQIAAGDLTVQTENVSEKDVLGRAFAQMVYSLRTDKASVAEAIAQGDLSVIASSNSENDTLGNSFVKMVETLKEKAIIANAIADGDLDVEVILQSENDVLGKAFIRMLENLRERAEQAEAISNGDITIDAQPKSDKDSLGKAFAKMVASLRGLIGQVAQTSNTLTQSSMQLSNAAEEAGNATQGIASASQEVAKGASEQTQSVTETTESMRQLTASIDQISKGGQAQAESVEQAAAIVNQVSTAIGEVATSAQSAATGSREASEAAQNGAGMVRQTIDGMGLIRSAVESASNRIADLGTQSDEIGKIVAVIDDIASQTNLLALNAAIEAARAGEQGRGFAVVADEVRSLAERVTDATKEIANLIDNIQKGVTESVKAVEEGSREVQSGMELAEHAGEALNTILESVERVGQQIEQISASAEQVSASSDEMVNNINNVNAITEENTAASEEMAESSNGVMKAIESIANITQENSVATEQVSNSAKRMSVQVEEVVSSSQALAEMAESLQNAVSSFRIENSGTNPVPKGEPIAKEPEMEFEEVPA